MDYFGEYEHEDRLHEDGHFEDGLYENSLYEDDLYEDGLYEDDLYEYEAGIDEDGLYESSLYEDGLYEDDLYEYEAGIDEDGLYENSLYEDDPYEVYEDGLYEGDFFFKKIGRAFKKVAGKVGRGLKKIVRSPIFKGIARKLAMTVGGIFGGPGGAALANSIAGAVLREAEFESEAEMEAAIYESEAEFEDIGGDYEAFAEFEDLSFSMAATESEAEADALLRRKVSLIPRLLRRSPQLRQVYPKLKRAYVAVVQQLRKNPQTKSLIPLMPIALRRSMPQLAQLARRGRIDDKAIIKIFSENVAWVTANQKRVRALAIKQQRDIHRNRKRVRRVVSRSYGGRKRRRRSR